MNNEKLSTPEAVFPLRVDRRGYRPVYKLGNEGGNCSFGCKFCGVGRSIRVTSAENIARFDALHANYLTDIDGPFHPAIFNRGNVTDPKAFSWATLDHIFQAFEEDERVVYLSLNSRESTATSEVLDRLAEPRLPFPIHFIFGQESFRESAPRVLGKNNRGEMERFVEKLKPYNQRSEPVEGEKRYMFGLDVNLLFLPELYLDAGETRTGHESKIAEGLADDLRALLNRTNSLVPFEVNIHPYYEVPTLPYEKADLLLLLRILPKLQRIVDEFNRKPSGQQTGLFLGVVFVSNPQGAGAGNLAKQSAWLQTTIERFNRVGTCSIA